MFSLVSTTLYSCAYWTCMSLSLRFALVGILKKTGLSLDINTPASKWNCQLPLPGNIYLLHLPLMESGDTCYWTTLESVFVSVLLHTYFQCLLWSLIRMTLMERERKKKAAGPPSILYQLLMVEIWIIDFSFFSCYLLSMLRFSLTFHQIILETGEHVIWWPILGAFEYSSVVWYTVSLLVKWLYPTKL